jgi:hypothetical protein
MKRHKFNIFPEAKTEDYERLKQDIEANGYDSSQPIILYQGDILDGWNRQKACNELKEKPTYETFQGTDEEAIRYMMRTNKRRNLNSGQWACIAVEAEDLIEAIRKQVDKQRRTKQAEALSEAHKAKDSVCNKKLLQTERDPNKNATPTKTAELFNTNRTYVNQASKLKEQAPEVFEAVKAGTMRMTDGSKAVKAIPTDPWSKDERERQEKVQLGQSVVANANQDKNLIQWAEKVGKAVRIDRGTKYGNPFILPHDGDRDYVCNCFRDHYLPNKPSILKDAPLLQGKVLICHCYPERCHGDSLIEMLDKPKRGGKK